MTEDGLTERIVAEARSWIGTPYRHQAALKGVGCDCLGLVRGVWGALYGQEPEAPGAYQPGWVEPPDQERLRDAARRHMREIPLEERQVGDVLMFRWRDYLPAKHIGIATSPDTMVHAHEGASVTEVALGLWQTRLVYAFRFPTIEDTA
jgi:NlpC/P60 family putative phage cell wall peptidase